MLEETIELHQPFMAMIYRRCEKMIKESAEYRRVYDQAKHKSKKANPDATHDQIHELAREDLAQVLLSHMLIVREKAEGIPAEMSQDETEFLESYGALDPADFGWKKTTPDES